MGLTLKTVLEALNGWNKSTYGLLSFHNQTEVKASGKQQVVLLCCWNK